MVALPFPMGELPAPSGRTAGAARCIWAGVAFSCSPVEIEDWAGLGHGHKQVRLSCLMPSGKPCLAWSPEHWAGTAEY